MITARNASTAKQIESVSCRNASSVLKGIIAVRIRNAANVLKTVFSPGAAFMVDTPDAVFGARTSTAAGQVTTEVATATPNGGTGPYTYLWTRTDANPETWDIISATTAGSSFRVGGVSPSDTFTATFKCTVTDTNGIAADSNDVTATAVNFGSPI